MPQIPVGFYNVEFVFNVVGSPRDITWSMGFDYSGDPSGDPLAVAQLVYTRFTNASGPYVPAQMNSGWSFLGTVCTFQDESGPLVANSFESVVGTALGTTVPVNCAILATKQTASGGRRNKGRAYLPPVMPSETSIDNVGQITGPTLSDLQELYDFAFADMDAIDLEPVLFHQSAPFTPTPVTGFVLSSLLATQRRRMRG